MTQGMGPAVADEACFDSACASSRSMADWMARCRLTVSLVVRRPLVEGMSQLRLWNNAAP
jgi:hypothetical protein